MQKAIQFICLSILILFFLSSGNAGIIDLEGYKQKPAAILREFLNIINETNLQICHLNNSKYYFDRNYVVFNPIIKVVLPNKYNKQDEVNCMFVEGYDINNELKKPHDLESLHYFLKLIKNSLVLPVKIQWNTEIIRIIIGSSFDNKKFSYQIILNIDPEENHRILHSTLTSTLHPMITNECNQNNALNNYQPYCSPAQVRFIRVSPSFNNPLDDSLLELQDTDTASNTETTSNEAFAAIFEKYVDYMSQEQDKKLKKLNSLGQSDDLITHQNQQNRKSIASLTDSQVMYLSDSDDSISDSLTHTDNFEKSNSEDDET